jgi:predicted acylesterase/phospholipase RssA
MYFGIAMKRGFPWFAVLVVPAFLTSGCVTSPPVQVMPRIAEANSCVSPVPDSPQLIGLAVSGGGSRAALYAAGGMEALAALRVGRDQRSLLEQVSHISSVSGGSLASAYYTLKKPGHTIPMLTSEGKMSEEYRRFFTEFKHIMSLDYEAPLLRRQMYRLRWFNPSWTAKSLAEILHEDYLGDATFDQLKERESRGDAPRLILNTTLYNSGRRFILSTLPGEDSRYDLFRMPSLSERGGATGTAGNDALRERWESLLSVTPQDVRIDHCRIPIAAAVAASMSFPPIIGPITFHIEDQDLYLHAGDGGLSDNTGVESLAMIFLKKLHEGKARRAVIIALDSSFPFDVGGERLNNFAEGFSLFSYDYSRITTIMEERAAAYRMLFFNAAQKEGLLPGADKLLIVAARHTDAQWNEDLSDLPESCHGEKPPMSTPRAVVARLAKIVTRLWLDSACERDLVLTAARKIVAQKEQTIRAFLEQ